MKREIEVVFSPALFSYRKLKENTIIVIVDILRATTSICAAFDYGVKAIIPVRTLEEAREYKDKGYIVAGERIEYSFDFADFGNSAFDFMNDIIVGKEIVHSTTNGTVAITMAKEANASEVLIGAFTNLEALVEYLVNKEEDILILCSGWNNSFCLEDSVFAGALVDELSKRTEIINHNDAAFSCSELWRLAKEDLKAYMENASHIHRLRKHNMGEVFDYTFSCNSTKVIPILRGDRLMEIKDIDYKV
ncbi:MAG: 2-phosphosulfolactate phosphatase [Bacteroidales bacterium]|nr:2-phosphosulfolactate phosphatase [Bacteroidales bacterium]